jgi:hypothetical protein
VADPARGSRPSTDGDDVAQTSGQPVLVPRTAVHDRESADPGHGEADPTRDGRTPASGSGPSDLGLGESGWGRTKERRVVRRGGRLLAAPPLVVAAAGDGDGGQQRACGRHSYGRWRVVPELSLGSDAGVLCTWKCFHEKSLLIYKSISCSTHT